MLASEPRRHHQRRADARHCTDELSAQDGTDMTLFHLYGDESGATHLAPLELTVEETPVGTVRGLRDIPATTAAVMEFVNRKPDLGLHVSPQRQCFVVLKGVLEVTTSLGHTEHLGVGDIFLADDVGTQGHISRDIGDDPLMLLAMPLDPNWHIPAHVSVPAENV